MFIEQNHAYKLAYFMVQCIILETVIVTDVNKSV